VAFAAAWHLIRQDADGLPALERLDQHAHAARRGGRHRQVWPGSHALDPVAQPDLVRRLEQCRYRAQQGVRLRQHFEAAEVRREDDEAVAARLQCFQCRPEVIVEAIQLGANGLAAPEIGHFQCHAPGRARRVGNHRFRCVRVGKQEILPQPTSIAAWQAGGQQSERTADRLEQAQRKAGNQPEQESHRTWRWVLPAGADLRSSLKYSCRAQDPGDSCH